MAQTVANLGDVLKEAWTSDRLEKQFYDENPFLDKITKGSFPVSNTKIGEKAIVPIHSGRSGGYTSTNAAGGNLNAADAQKVDAAEYTLAYHWFQVSLQTAALNQAASSTGSAVVAKSLELEGAISDTMKQCSRQIVTNSDGIIAACDTGGASTTVELLVDSATAYGYQALVRGWLYKGLTIDIGATTNTDSVVAGAVIQSINESSTDPDIIIDSSVSTTSGTDFVYIANPNSGTAANTELNGLRSMVGSTTSALGGLDPDNAGEEFWKPAHVDTTTTALSLGALLTAQLRTGQRGANAGTQLHLTSLKQEAAYYEILQNQVRFTGDGSMGAGQVGGVTFAGREVMALPDVLDTDWFILNLPDLLRVTGEGITKPTWASDIEGAGGRLRWGQGTTAFNDAVVYPWQFGMTRRNRSGAFLGLTA